MALYRTTVLAGTASRARRVSAPVVGLLVAMLCAPLLLVTHHTVGLVLPRAEAIAALLRSPTSAKIIAGTHWGAATVGPVDGQLDRVTLLAHDRTIAEFGVSARGVVTHAVALTGSSVPYGNWLAYEPGIVVGLAGLFTLLTGVAPLRRMRNLDVVAALSLLAPVVLLQQRYIDASVLAAVPGLAYLMVRCGHLALGQARAPAPSRPLLSALTPRLDARQRVRLLRALLGALALIFVLVGISSTEPVDVIYGVMEGATKLIHGVLPYGHMPGDVVHGDTYPVLSYALYAPVAAFEPVGSMWDTVDLALAAGVAAALVTAATLARAFAGGRSRRQPRPRELEEAGLRAALAWLSFPPVLITVSTGTTDVALGAMIAIAVVLWRRPAASSAMLAAAAWFKFTPVVLLPVWLAARRGRRLVAALGAMLAVSVAMAALLVAVGGAAGPRAMIHAISYQFSRGSPRSLWSALGIGALQPVAQACLLGLIAAVVLRARREPALVEDRARLAALSAMLVIGLELSANYWAFLYIAWVLPLLCLSLLERAAASPVAVPAPATADRPALRPLYGR